MRSFNTNKVIFSAFKAALTEQANFANHIEAKELLRKAGFKFVELEGVYNGVRELSLMLESHDIREHEMHLQAALSIASDHTQESILESHNDGFTTLRFLEDQSVMALGQLRASKELDSVSGLDSYSYDFNNGVYYFVK